MQAIYLYLNIVWSLRTRSCDSKSLSASGVAINIRYPPLYSNPTKTAKIYHLHFYSAQCLLWLCPEISTQSWGADYISEEEILFTQIPCGQIPVQADFVQGSALTDADMDCTTSASQATNISLVLRSLQVSGVAYWAQTWSVGTSGKALTPLTNSLQVPILSTSHTISQNLPMSQTPHVPNSTHKAVWILANFQLLVLVFFQVPIFPQPVWFGVPHVVSWSKSSQQAQGSLAGVPTAKPGSR